MEYARLSEWRAAAIGVRKNGGHSPTDPPFFRVNNPPPTLSNSLTTLKNQNENLAQRERDHVYD